MTTARSISRRSKKTRILHPHLSQAEHAAWMRIRARETDTERIQIDDAVAIRRLGQCSPKARAFVWSMVARLSTHDDKVQEFSDAAGTFGIKTLSWCTLDELHDAGLMTVRTNGNHVLHPFFTGLGHAVRRRSEADSDGDGGSVLDIATKEARG